MTCNTNDITELVSKIKNANKAYRIGVSVISDTEYDNLIDTLKSKIEAEEFEKFRKTLTEDSGKVTHPYVMGSLDKIKAFDTSASISDWILKTIPNNDSSEDGLFISSKIDGCSARLTYIDGQLIGASTRGDGYKGVDIFNKVQLFAPKTLKHKFTGDIRGEITLTYETYDELTVFKNGMSYKNLRNGTAGLLNGKDVSNDEISFLRFFAYEIMGETQLTKKKQFEKLKYLGFETALSTTLTDIFDYRVDYSGKSIDDAFLKIYNEFSEKAQFDIDGLVVSDINDSDVFENEFIPKRTVAVKFNQMTADTKLIDVIWNVSKGGRLSPVGVVESVELGGSCVSNVTLNNLRIMKEQGLKYGCTVTVLKSGDVIPKIVGVKHCNENEEIDIELPSKCPSCGMPLKYEEDALYPMCTNENCNAIVHSKILHFLRQLGIKHVSLKTISKFNLRSISDLVNLVPDEGAVKKTFYDDLNKLMFGASKEKLLSAFDYDGVSSQIIDKMISHYGYDVLINSEYEDLVSNLPYGVGDKFLKKFVTGYSKIRDEYLNILSNNRYYGTSEGSSISSNNVVDGILCGKSFVVTGALDSMSRESFKKFVIENGGIYQSSVSKKTNYLVCNDISTATSKVKKAESFGVLVINEQKFLNMIKDGSDGFALF